MTTRALVPDAVGTSLIAQQSRQQYEVLTKQIAPGATEVELEYFLASARHAQLDPYAIPKLIVCFRSREQDDDGNWVSKYTPMVTIDGWRKLLSDTGRVEGIDLEWCGPDGVWRDSWPDDKVPTAARATIWLIGRQRPQRFVAHYADFVLYKRQSREPRALWAKMPRHMLAIRALTHCAKQALPAIASLLENVGDLDFGDDDGDDASFNLARRRFWARASELGLTEDQVREAFHLGPDESLDEFMRRREGFGYGRYIPYLEGWAASPRAQIPARTREEVRADEERDRAAGGASTLLYNDDVVRHFERSVDSAASTDVTVNRYVESETAGSVGDPGPGSGGSPTSAPAADECPLCGALGPLVDGPDGTPLCQRCKDETVVREPLVVFPPLPAGVTDYVSFCRAAGLAPERGGLGRSTAEVLTILGRGIGWQDLTHDELAVRWARVASQPVMETDSA